MLFRSHIVAGTTFTSNFLLLSESSYFDIATRAKPLLHLWSLGIEEQFYIAWPITLIIVHWLRLNRLVTVFLLLIAALLINLFTSNLSEAAKFYSPLSRAWELLFGAMIACISTIDSFNYTPASIHRSTLVQVFNKYKTGIKNTTSVVGLFLKIGRAHV